MSEPGEQQPGLEANISYQLLNVGIAFTVLETLFVALRFLAGRKRRINLGLDDYLILPAFVFNIGLIGLALAFIPYCRAGRHLQWILYNDPGAITTFLKLEVPFTTLYLCATTFSKLTILGLYLRIFVERKQRIATYTLGALLTIYWAISVVIACAQCIPITHLWDPESSPGGHCLDGPALWRWASFPGVVLDILMFFLPLPCIWKLHLSVRDKIGLAITFGMGSVGVITCSIRLAFYFQTDSKGDVTWIAVKLLYISIVESGVYLMAACLPTYRVLFRVALKRIGLSKQESELELVDSATRK